MQLIITMYLLIPEGSLYYRT